MAPAISDRFGKSGDYYTDLTVGHAISRLEYVVEDDLWFGSRLNGEDSAKRTALSVGDRHGVIADSQVGQFSIRYVREIGPIVSVWKLSVRG